MCGGASHMHTHMLNKLKIHVKKLLMANTMGASISMFNVVCVYICVQVWGFTICGWMGGVMSITENGINLEPLIKII